MIEKTNLERVKSVARMLLLTPVHKTPYSPVVVQHPFTSCGIATAKKDGIKYPIFPSWKLQRAMITAKLGLL